MAVNDNGRQRGRCVTHHGIIELFYWRSGLSHIFSSRYVTLSHVPEFIEYNRVQSFYIVLQRPNNSIFGTARVCNKEEVAVVPQFVQVLQALAALLARLPEAVVVMRCLQMLV